MTSDMSAEALLRLADQVSEIASVRRLGLLSVECGRLEEASRTMRALAVQPAEPRAEGRHVVISYEVAKIIDAVFLPTNPNKMRNCDPQVPAAAHVFKAALAKSDVAETSETEPRLKAINEAQDRFEVVLGIRALLPAPQPAGEPAEARLGKRAPARPELANLIALSCAWFNSLSPEQQEAHLSEQSKSWARGELAMGSDADEAREREAFRTEGGV